MTPTDQTIAAAIVGSARSHPPGAPGHAGGATPPGASALTGGPTRKGAPACADMAEPPAVARKPPPARLPDAAAPGVRPRGDTNLNPPGVGLLALLREDLRTHDGDYWEQGFWAIAVHRFGNWRMGVEPKLLRLPFSLLYKFLFKWVQWTCGVTLPYTVRVGRRVRIWHHGGMVLNARSIGDDVHLRQNTTFGVARKDRLYYLPTIEDRCDIGCGAVVMGAVTIGHDSAVGANAVVLKDVPPHSVAVGVPAKIIKTADAGEPGQTPVSPTDGEGERARGVA